MFALGENQPLSLDESRNVTEAVLIKKVADESHVRRHINVCNSQDNHPYKIKEKRYHIVFGGRFKN